MSDSIRCPHCTARLSIKNPALRGRTLRCPKCQQPLQVPAATVESPGFASLDFDEKEPVNESWLEPELPVGQAAMWSAPVREVPLEQPKKVLTPEESAKLQARREYSLLMTGGAVCGVLVLIIGVVGSIAVWRSIQRNQSVPIEENSPVTADASTTGSGNLPTVFGFDESRRGLLVDYLVSQGNGKPKAKLTMAMVVNSLKKLAADFNVQPSEEFPEQLELLRERIIMRDVPDELLKSDKLPAVFQKMISEYQEKQLGPAEEEVAVLVILAYLGPEM